VNFNYGGVNLKSNLKNTISLKNILKITYPVILSMFSLNIMTFVDRAFVSKSSISEFAAVVPASNLATTISSIFIGIIGFGATIIAQYNGAKSYDDCAKTLWNSIFLSIIFSLILLAISPIASNTFALMGHHGKLLKYEIQFFYLIIFSSCFQILSTGFSNFFKGISHTKETMFVGIVSNIINILLDYILIFGRLGCPRLGGILGSGLSTLLSCFISVLMYIFLINKQTLKYRYNLFSNLKLDKNLALKLLHFGLPSGMQTFVGTGYFTLLLLIIGKTGEFNLSCANIAFTIESVSVWPVQGIGIAIGIIVGNEIGAGKIHNIKKVLKKGLILGFLFNIILILMFNIFPDVLIALFNSSNNKKILACTITLIKITSMWLVFDTIQIIIGNVLKSAGDTVFMMVIFTTVPFAFYIALPYILCVMSGLNIYWVWIDLLIFTFCMLALVSIRFVKGKWKTIQVI